MGYSLGAERKHLPGPDGRGRGGRDGACGRAVLGQATDSSRRPAVEAVERSCRAARRAHRHRCALLGGRSAHRAPDTTRPTADHRCAAVSGRSTVSLAGVDDGAEVGIPARADHIAWHAHRDAHLRALPFPCRGALPSQSPREVLHAPPTGDARRAGTDTAPPGQRRLLHRHLRPAAVRACTRQDSRPART